MTEKMTPEEIEAMPTVSPNKGKYPETGTGWPEGTPVTGDLSPAAVHDTDTGQTAASSGFTRGGPAPEDPEPTPEPVRVGDLIGRFNEAHPDDDILSLDDLDGLDLSLLSPLEVLLLRSLYSSVLDMNHLRASTAILYRVGETLIERTARSGRNHLSKDSRKQVDKAATESKHALAALANALWEFEFNAISAWEEMNEAGGSPEQLADALVIAGRKQQEELKAAYNADHEDDDEDIDLSSVDVLGKN